MSPEQREHHRARVAAWKRANPERHSAHSRASYNRHAEARKAVVRKYRETNGDQISARKRAYFQRTYPARKEAHAEKREAWRQKNRERARWHVRMRRARVRGAVGWATPEQIAARIAYYGHRCYLCGGAYESIDHVIPVSRGGSNWPANMRPACGRCNSRKRDRRLAACG